MYVVILNSAFCEKLSNKYICLPFQVKGKIKET